MTEAERLYSVRDHQAQGDYYLRHVSAMTGEGLHAKSAIAGELAHRDMVIEAQAAEIEALRKQIANLKTVMIAAAEEIHAHWDAHCDAEGYGPQNLMRRLEECIPSEYGYTAGAFEALRAAIDAARKG